MKIGILTLWWSNDNYGQLLQAWALQRQLYLLGHEPFLIRYSEYDRSKVSWKNKLIYEIKKIPLLGQLYKFFKINNYWTLYKRNKQRDFDGFRENNLSFSKQFYSSLNEFQEDYPVADAYIVGSDQVWAHLLDKEYNSIFFLNFGNKDTRRIAYAPSFGMECYPEQLMSKLNIALSRFDTLSVREISGAKICKDAGYEAVHVLDPTMLITPNEYRSLIVNKEEKYPYIYIYSININKAEQLKWEALQSFANSHQFRTITTTASGYFTADEIFGNTEYEYSTIPQWLSNIANAAMVVTTSFHGVVFSVLFHTKFVYFPIEGSYGRGNGRVLSLLNTLGLSNCIYNSSSSFDEMYNTEINWTEVDKVIELNRKESLKFLINSLKR